ncbi:MAG: hypothetical protein ACE5EO_04555 [Candidatus Krumholzibacteriia bacterium]
MATLKWTGQEFKVVKQLMTTDVFREWVGCDGQTVLEDVLGKTRARWFFGKQRAKRKILDDARNALKPGARFAAVLKKRLDDLPDVIRKCGIGIKKKGHRDLFSIDTTMALVAIPRGVARNEFALYLIDNLAAASSLARFRGLARRVLGEVAREAEQLFYEKIKKGAQFVHPEAKAVVLGVEPEFGWRLNGIDGHYYCGYSTRNGKDLAQKKELRQFKSEIEEIVFGQRVHLNRLGKEEVVAIADSFREK